MAARRVIAAAGGSGAGGGGPDRSRARPMPTIAFKSARAFRVWLQKNHARPEGIWLRIYKKDSGVATVTYAQALDQALCFGWIDGQKLPVDAQSWLQKFTPRRRRSGWSKRNTGHAQRLIASGEMTRAGLAEVEAAQADGRWPAAYDAFGSAAMPADFLADLARNKKAQAFFDSLNRTNLYSIAYRLQTAKKPETRAKRKATIIAMLARGEKFH
jgi:uncharacterized protein YdeI (YjbR/CyaY-like superfamily)